jgi:LacI family transcriptional regulator
LSATLTHCVLVVKYFIMSKFLKKVPRVLVMVTPTSQKVLREKAQGILRYARLHGPWEVQILDDRSFISKLEAFNKWQPDGIITRETPKVLASHIPRVEKTPTVFFDADPLSSSRRMRVQHDVSKASEAVADYYMKQKRLRHFTYVASASEPQPFWSSMRGEAFARRLKEGGYECEIYAPKTTKDWGAEQQDMSEWLLSLPKPCGLFAAFDSQAKQVLDTCLSAGIRVPEEVAVIGADDDEMICENTIPTLSSVQSNYADGGFMAAELLDQLMRGKIRKSVTLSYGFNGIIHRQSSQFISEKNWCATAAAEFIRLNACEGITVPDVAHHLHVSRSFAEKTFRKALGHSILEEIQTRRLERLCTLLRETPLSIGEIGERCGYHTESYLKRLFKKKFGMTMREYRRNR